MVVHEAFWNFDSSLSILFWCLLHNGGWRVVVFLKGAHFISCHKKKKDFDTKRIKMFVVISLSVFPSFCCLPIWHTLTPFMMEEQHSSVCCLDCQHTMKWVQADNPLTNGWCLQTLLLYSVLDPETCPNSNNFYPPSFLSVFTSCILSGVLELLQTF